MPRGAAQPASAVSLDSLDHRIGVRQVPEADTHLVQDYLVVDRGAASREKFGDATGVVTGPVDKVRDAATSQLLQGRPGREATGPPRRLGGHIPEHVVVLPEPVKYAAE